MNQHDLSKLQCHFTWDFVPRDKPERFLLDRIKTIECELKSQEYELESQEYEKSKGSKSQRNLPQLYTLRGYLKTQLYKRTDDGGNQSLNDAEDSFLSAYNASTTTDHKWGYLAVIYGNIIPLSQIKDDTKIDISVVIDAYNELSQKMDLENHPQVLAMKGFTANFMHCHQHAMQFYKRTLMIEENAEWLFGLALVKLHRDVGRTKSENDEIEMLLRQALQLDPSYNMAKVKLARLLWGERGENGLEEVERLIAPLLDNIEEKGTTLLEELAALLVRLENPMKLKGVDIFEICEGRNSTSQKTLRGLGNYYSYEWKKKKSPSNEHFLNDSIKYFTNLVSGMENAKPFDITQLGYIHLTAFRYHKRSSHQKQRNQANVDQHRQKAKEHQGKSKQWYEKAAEQLKKGHHDLRNDIETCFRLSEYYKEFVPEREEEYLRKTLIKAHQGSEEDAFGELDFVKKARERLLEVVTKQTGNELTMFQTKAWAYELTGHFESALFYLEEAILVCGGMSQQGEMLEKIAELCLEIVKDKRRHRINFEISMDNLDQKIKQLSEGPKKRSLSYESQKIRIEDLMSAEEVLKCLEKRAKEFENFVRLQRLNNWSAGEAFIDKIIDIAHASKVVLDRSVKYIKVQLYPEGKDFLYYPKPTDLKGKNEQERRDALKKTFHKTNKWFNFAHDCQVLFDFFVDRLNLDNYPYLEGLVEVRKASICFSLKSCSPVLRTLIIIHILKA